MASDVEVTVPPLDTGAVAGAPVPANNSPGGSSKASTPGMHAEILSNTGIHKACMDRDIFAIESYLDQSPEVLEARDSFSMTPLMTASLCGDVAMVKLLVERGADLNAKDDQNRTCLHYAALNINSTIIGYLVHERGMDVNVLDASHRTPLYLASSNGKAQAVKELMAAGADATVPDNEGRTPDAVVCERTNGDKRRNSIKNLLTSAKQPSSSSLLSHGPVRRKSSSSTSSAAPAPEHHRRRSSGKISNNNAGGSGDNEEVREARKDVHEENKTQQETRQEPEAVHTDLAAAPADAHAPPEAPKRQPTLVEVVITEEEVLEVKALGSMPPADEEGAVKTDAPEELTPEKAAQASVQASWLLKELSREFVELHTRRQQALAQLKDGYLTQFTSKDDEKLKRIVEDFARVDEPEELRVVYTHDKTEDAHVAFVKAQEQVREAMQAVPESDVEANNVMTAHPNVASAVHARDETRVALFHCLVDICELVRPLDLSSVKQHCATVVMELEMMIQRSSRGMQLENRADKSYAETLELARECLMQVQQWETEVDKHIRAEGDKTMTARTAVASALSDLASAYQACPASAGDRAQCTSSVSLDEALKDLAAQMADEGSHLSMLQTGTEVQPPFPHKLLFEVAVHVKRELLRRVEGLNRAIAACEKWKEARAELEPWMAKPSEQVVLEFVSRNRMQKEELLRIEDEIIDKNYEKAKIQNARQRKGSSAVRAAEARANQEAIDELKEEKRAATRARRDFLMTWRRHKAQHLPELPLSRAEVIGTLHAQVNMGLLDSLVDLFAPSRAFADYNILPVTSPKDSTPSPHGLRAEYEGKTCVLKVYPRLSSSTSSLQAFERDVRNRHKLQSWGVSIVPIDAVFTEDDNGGTGYIQVAWHERDLASWASEKRRTFVELQQILQKVLAPVTVLHSFNMAHGGITPDMFMMDRDDNPLLADFEASPQGLPSYTRRSIVAAHTNFDFVAPELRASGSGASKATLEADAYACGVLISKMLELCGLTGAQEASSFLDLATRLTAEDAGARITVAQAASELASLISRASPESQTDPAPAPKETHAADDTMVKASEDTPAEGPNKADTPQKTSLRDSEASPSAENTAVVTVRATVAEVVVVAEVASVAVEQGSVVEGGQQEQQKEQAVEPMGDVRQAAGNDTDGNEQGQVQQEANVQGEQQQDGGAEAGVTKEGGETVRDQ